MNTNFYQNIPDNPKKPVFILILNSFIAITNSVAAYGSFRGGNSDLAINQLGFAFLFSMWVWEGLTGKRKL